MAIKRVFCIISVVFSRYFILLITGLALCTPSTQAVADVDELALPRFEFSLPADDLAKTLIEFAVQCHIPVVVPYDLIEHYRSSPVIGTLTATDALGKILKHTPFTYQLKLLPRRQITIIPRPLSTVSLRPEAAPAPRPEATGVEEVLVTGIRASLLQSVDIKRSANGIVDAITAKDMGQFPDTNLAESIQRIPGASISRNNGEGSKVTVRGFTGNYNLVTFNGRTMPVVSTPVDQVADSRAFDFSHLASENVSRVAIYKTHRADLADGGIGATIDIQSYKPLDNTQQNYLSLKAIHDTSNRNGRSITPELAGLFTLGNGDTWAISLAASVQERDSGTARAYVNAWQTQPWVAAGEQGAIGKHATPCAITQGNPGTDQCFRIVNAPSIGQLYSLPADLHYALVDSTRERVNGRLIAQFRPQEQLTLTLDYAVFKNTLNHSAAEMQLRLTDYRSYLQFDQNAVATPVVTTETFFDDQGQASAIDLGFAAQLHEQENLTESTGFNLEFAPNDVSLRQPSTTTPR